MCVQVRLWLMVRDTCLITSVKIHLPVVMERFYLLVVLVWLSSQGDASKINDAVPLERNESIKSTDDSITYMPPVQWTSSTENPRSPYTCDERCGLPYVGNVTEMTEAERVVGGREARPNQFPWMVQLWIKVPDIFKELNLTCGATLIKRQYLLTAAHCVHFPIVKSVIALIGFHYIDIGRFPRTGQEMIIPVTRIMVHPLFTPEDMEHDIAVLELAQPVPLSDQVHTICLANKEMRKPPDGTNVAVAGWGFTKAFGTPVIPQMLLSTDLSVVSSQPCRDSYGDMAKFITKNVICAGGVLKDSCKGDSGGPLMLPINNGTRYVEIGVTSWGSGCAQTGQPGVYNRVSTHVEWIQSVTMEKDPCLPFPPA